MILTLVVVVTVVVVVEEAVAELCANELAAAKARTRNTAVIFMRLIIRINEYPFDY
jgi:hypothetical protein